MYIILNDSRCICFNIAYLFGLTNRYSKRAVDGENVDLKVYTNCIYILILIEYIRGD